MRDGRAEEAKILSVGETALKWTGLEESAGKVTVDACPGDQALACSNNSVVVVVIISLQSRLLQTPSPLFPQSTSL